MTIDQVFKYDSDSGKKGTAPDSPYPEGVLIILSEILSDAFHRYIIDIDSFFKQSFSLADLLVRGFNHTLFSQRLNFLKKEILSFKENADSNKIEKIKIFDLSDLKDYQLAKNFFESEFSNNLDYGKKSLSEEEAKVLVLTFIMIIGTGDAINIYFLLSAVNKYLLKKSLKFNSRRYLYRVGLNNLEFLLKLKTIHTTKNRYFRIEELVEIEFMNKNLERGVTGCPFVLHEVDALNRFLDILDELFDKIFDSAPLGYCPNSFGDGFLELCPLFSSTRFTYSKEKLLASKFVSEIV